MFYVWLLNLIEQQQLEEPFNQLTNDLFQLIDKKASNVNDSFYNNYRRYNN